MTDPDTKQVDMGTRWYQAGLGRFTARDVLFGELTSPMTLNQHVYGGPNPISMWDPTGMYQDDAGGGGPCQGVTCYTDYSDTGSCGGCGSGSSSSGAASAQRRPEQPRPDPPRIPPTAIARDSAVGLATRALEYGTALDREAHHIWDKIGRGFVEGRAIQTWDAVAFARHGSTAARVSRFGGSILRGAARAAPWANAVWDTVSDLRSDAPPSGVISRNALAFGAALTVEKAGLAACANLAATGGGAAICAGFVTVGAAFTYGMVRAGVDPEDMAYLVDQANPYGRSEGWADFLVSPFG
jgi:RHS repeat-associated protein